MCWSGMKPTSYVWNVSVWWRNVTARRYSFTAYASHSFPLFFLFIQSQHRTFPFSISSCFCVICVYVCKRFFFYLHSITSVALVNILWTFCEWIHTSLQHNPTHWDWANKKKVGLLWSWNCKMLWSKNKSLKVLNTPLHCILYSVNNGIVLNRLCHASQHSTHCMTYNR